MSKNFTHEQRFSVNPSKLGWLFLLFCMLNFAGINHAIGQNKWKSDLLNYINGKLAKPDGGFGWEDQYDSHSTPTFATIGVLNAIGQLPKDKKALIEFVKTHHPQKLPLNEAGPSGTDLRNLVYEQIQAVLWLGGDPSGFKGEVSGWKSQAGKLANYETQNYPVLIQEVMTPICRKLLNLPIAEVTPEFVKYLKSRQRPNGSFNNSPLSNGGDGNILNTYWSLYTLNVLDQKDLINKEVISWINACQLKNGGFHPST